MPVRVGADKREWNKSASGIGKACALAFAKNGACGIVVADIDLDAANVLAAECNLQFQEQHRSTVGGSGIVAPFAHAVSIDVTDSASVACATEYAAQKLGRMDYCVNAAGVSLSPVSFLLCTHAWVGGPCRGP